MREFDDFRFWKQVQPIYDELFWDQVWPSYSDYDVDAIKKDEITSVFGIYNSLEIAKEEMSRSQLVTSIADAYSSGAPIDADLHNQILESVADRFGVETDHVDLAITRRVSHNLTIWHQRYMASLTEEA